MSPTLEKFGANIVVVGNFNPRIFTVDWLERNELIGPDDAETARQEKEMLVTSQVSRIETEWFLLQVLEQRLSIESRGVVTPKIQDLAIGIFSVLVHLPVGAIGINFDAHYGIGSVDGLHKIGDALAPKGPWHKAYPAETHAAGLERLTIRIDPFPRGGEAPQFRDYKQYELQPSKHVSNGVYVTYNNHFDIEFREDASDNKGTSAAISAKILEECWQASWDESTKTFLSVLEQALAS